MKKENSSSVTVFYSCPLSHSPSQCPPLNDKSWVLWHHNSWLLYQKLWCHQGRIMTSRKNGGREYSWQETTLEQRRYFHANLHPESQSWPFSAWVPVEALWVPIAPPPCGLMVCCVDIAQVWACMEVPYWPPGFWAGFGFYSCGWCWIEPFREELRGAWHEVDADVHGPCMEG